MVQAYRAAFQGLSKAGAPFDPEVLARAVLDLAASGAFELERPEAALRLEDNGAAAPKGSESASVAGRLRAWRHRP